ncbi:histone H3.v1-like [Acomys russatus]|uniref:histone H3.v1-like n=1 Tax=Acomys russatus TaxID=60746 RepID=UPI0021E331E3|nr:histone H3.v1-like [Acomys russatus]
MEWHGHVPWPVSHWASDFGEERWMNSIFNPVPKIPPVDNIWDKEKEEEEEGEEKEEEEEEEEVDQEQEKEDDASIKTFLGVPKQDSMWGLRDWPRPSLEQARWWEDFSLPPLRGPCLLRSRLSTKMRLHPLPSLTSCLTPKGLQSLSASREEPSWLRNQPLMEPPPAFRSKTPKAVPRLPPKVSPKRSTVPKALVSMWPPITVNSRSKSSALKEHTPSAKEASHIPSFWGNPLPHLPSK